MKSLLLLFATVLPTLALAQAPAPAGGSSPVPAAAPPAAASSPSAGNTHDAAATVPLPGQTTGPALEKNIPLIPETAPYNPRSARSGRSRPGASPHQFATFQTEQDIRARIRIREAQTRAFNDPAIQADWAAAHRAHTDPERRALLTIYYNHLFNRMIKIEPTFAARVNARREAALARMKYNRLGDLDPSENPFGTVTPAASGPNPPGSDTPQ